MRFIRTHIRDCWMQVGEDKYPLSSYEARFELNSIPTAALRPAVGRDFHKPGSALDLSKLESGQPAEVFLTVEGGYGTRKLFSGYIEVIQGADTGDAFSRRQEAQVTLRHVSSVLAGSPAASVVFTALGNITADLMDIREKMTLFGTANNPDATLNPAQAFLTELDETLRRTPGSILLKAVDEILAGYQDTTGVVSVESGAAKATGLALRAYQGATFDQADLSPEVLSIQIASMFAAGGYTGTIWESLNQTLTQYYLALVPYSDGVWIANPSVYIRTDSVRLNASGIMNIRLQQARQLTPVQGVYMQVNTKFNDAVGLTGLNAPAVWPRTAAGGAVKGLLYHQRSLPDWISSMDIIVDGVPSAPKEKPGERATVKARFREPAAVSFVLGALKYAFSLENLSGQLSITTNYREDLHPGTRISVDVSGISGVSFMGSILHGLIVSTTHTINNAQGEPVFNTVLEVAGVRNEADNDNDLYTWAYDPLYREAWTGCRLDGRLLEQS